MADANARRGGFGGGGGVPLNSSGVSVQSTAELTRSTHMSETEQSVRRKQIKDIMKDSTISQQEKNKMIQGLMDGRRRSSMGSSVVSRSVHSESVYSNEEERQQHEYVNNMTQLARSTATGGSYFSDDEGDAIMSETPEDIYDYNQQDNRSVASSVSHTSNEDGPNLSSDGASVSAFASSSSRRCIPAGQYRQMHGRSFSLQEWNEESRATAAANASSLFAANPEQASRLMELSRPVCTHYDRQCTIVAACCGLAFGCRICHDECPVLPPPIHIRQRRAAGRLVADQVVEQSVASSNKHERRRSMPLENESFEDEEENHHLIDRFATREVICRHCYTRQSSKTYVPLLPRTLKLSFDEGNFVVLFVSSYSLCLTSFMTTPSHVIVCLFNRNNCKLCGATFGEYHCNICNLWMSNAESPYHCTACGFCRVGGRENFRHCNDCGMCIDILQFDDHNCKAGKYNSKCPVCQEDLFSSRQASHEMPCGHAIHWHCFKELTSFDTRCPVCKKTAETPETMAPTWSALAMGIALQPVPREMARVVNIICNDCGERDYERRWHFLGVRCMHCLSFNTNVEQIILQGHEAADFLDAQEAARGEETGGVPPTISALALAASQDDDDDMMMDDDDDDDELSRPGGVDTSASGTNPSADGRARRRS